jgi:hypothetical protein
MEVKHLECNKGKVEVPKRLSADHCCGIFSMECGDEKLLAANTSCILQNVYIDFLSRMTLRPCYSKSQYYMSEKRREQTS